ncbi:ROK family protein [Streptomyces flavovirens]|uniref:ROK family protein n=1 Tax=Streptomyces TaxID=1883 RepID=UPI000DAB8C1F|nr:MULTISPECIES: ROK family protein [unclassified Streptomyces]MYU37383.1 ROK family protein [Streptomyces sp. SID8358]MYX74478.1 ROK family protein [Streptomyces sp. SID3915]
MPDDFVGDCVIALDVGGTAMKGALLDRELKPLRTVRRATPRRSGPDAVIAETAAVLRDLHRSAATRELTVHGAGVVVPGVVDEENRTAVYSANLGWRDLPLAALIEDASGLPVSLGHDVRAGGAAECRLGAARGARDVWFVPVGTGISAAVFCDGRPVRAHGYAGELGHVVVEPDGEPCSCGARGCLETVASAAAIAATYSARSGRHVDGAAKVAALLARDDPDARAVWDRAVDALATAFATVTALLAPEVVVLGGGLAEAGALLLDPLRASLARRLTFQRRPELVPAALGDMAGCLGAGLAAWRTADGAMPLGSPSPERPEAAS